MPTHPRVETREVDGLPATLDGLWTAITITHEAAARSRALHSEDAGRALTTTIEQCEAAAGSLAASCARTLVRVEVVRDTAAEAPGRGPLPLDALITDCLALALDVLANEDEPLTPVEILAITRSVTALCASRQSLIEVMA